MKENKTMDSIHRGLLKKFHTLCSVLGMSEEEKRSLIEAYGVDSSRDIDTASGRHRQAARNSRSMTSGASSAWQP